MVLKDSGQNYILGRTDSIPRDLSDMNGQAPCPERQSIIGGTDKNQRWPSGGSGIRRPGIVLVVSFCDKGSYGLQSVFLSSAAAGEE